MRKQLLLKMLLMTVGLFMGTSAMWAAIDLTGMKVVATYDFTNDADLNTATLGVSATTAGKSYDFGGTTAIDVYECNAPAKLSGKFAFQGIGNAWSGKGWWIDQTDKGAGNNSLLANGASATRAAAILGIKKGYKVVFQVYDSNANSDFQIKGGTATYSETFETNEPSTNVKEYGVSVTEAGSVGFSSSKYNANGRMGIIKITVYGPEAELVAPTSALKSVAADSKTYTITNPNGSGTLYYTTVVANDAPEKGDAAYSSTTSASVDVVITESGKLYAYVADGGNSTDIEAINVNATPETLAQAGISLKSATKNAAGLLTDIVFTVSAPDNSAVELQPATETIEWTFTPDGGVESGRTAIAAGSDYTPTGKGTIKIHANTTGYAESVLEFPVSDVYVPSYISVDFSALEDASTLGNTWTEDATDAGTGDWTAWSTLPSKWKLETAKAVLDGRLYIANQNTVFLIKGWGITRPKKAYDYSGRYAVRGNIMGLYYHTSTSDISAVGDYYALATSGNGAIGDFMPNINVAADNTVYQLIDYAPGIASVTKTITDAGWATYCSPYALDFSSDIENLDAAYIVTAGSEGVLTLEEITTTVPANTGILLKGKGNVIIPVAASGELDTEDNKLVGVTEEYGLAAEAGYVLMNEGDGVGFYQNKHDFIVGANTAYLPANFDNNGGVSAPTFYGLFDGDVTGISATLVNSEKENSEIYNLAGQRVAAPTKGLYIVNGKKMVLK